MPLDVDTVLLDLVKGQATTQQMVQDMSVRLLGGNGQPGVLKLMHDEHTQQIKDLALEDEKTNLRIDATNKDITSLKEKSAWYSGIGTALGMIIGWAVQFITHRK
jgi:hypothetical protein